MAGINQTEVREVLDLEAQLNAIRAISQAAIEVPMVSAYALLPMDYHKPDPNQREAATVLATAPAALRLAREVVAAAQGLAERIENVEAITNPIAGSSKSKGNVVA